MSLPKEELLRRIREAESRGDFHFSQSQSTLIVLILSMRSTSIYALAFWNVCSI